MLPLSYTTSIDLRECLISIDMLRTKILTTPVAPTTENALRWETTLSRIQGSLAMADIKMHRREITKTLEIPLNKPSVTMGYKLALDHIQESWVANANLVTPDVIEFLGKIVYVGPLAPHRRDLHPTAPGIKQLLAYLDNQAEHPVIQAGISLGILSGVIFPAADPGLVARLVSCIFLAKHGYDLHGRSAVEHQWNTDLISYKHALGTIQTYENLNHWLLFFTQSVAADFTKRLHDINLDTARTLRSGFWKLNERQRAILHLLDDPTSVITNKTVQKRFHVSQITSSRDLSKLVTLTLIAPHGKGRSVSYTKI